jgi:hypothetical protein
MLKNCAPKRAERRRDHLVRTVENGESKHKFCFLIKSPALRNNKLKRKRKKRLKIGSKEGVKSRRKPNGHELKKPHKVNHG